MNPVEIQQLHTFVLLTLAACGELGIQESAILTRARVESFSELTAPQLSIELRSLADRKLILSYQPALGPQRWKITALGKAALQEANLA